MKKEIYELKYEVPTASGAWSSKSIICHSNNEDFSETPHAVKRYYKKDLEYFNM